MIWLDLLIETRGRALLGVELWAEIRRLKHVEGLSQREIHRRSGVHRDTIRKALATPTPPSYGRGRRAIEAGSVRGDDRGVARIVAAL